MSVPSFHGIPDVFSNLGSEIAGVIVCVQIVASHASGRAKRVPFLQAAHHFCLALVVHECDPIEFGAKIVNAEDFPMTPMNVRHADIEHVEAAIVTRCFRDRSMLVGRNRRAI